MKKSSVNGVEFNGKITIRMLCFLAAVMHFVFLLLFWRFKVMFLAYFNIGSVLFYITTGIIAGFEKAAHHFMTLVSLIFSEIVIHAVLCTIFLGVDVVFILYPICSLPVFVYYMFFYTKRSIFLRAIIIYIVSSILMLGMSVALAEINGGTILSSIAVLSRQEKTIFRVVNITFATIMLYGFTMMFYVEMSILMNKQRKLTEELKFTATHDALTGLTNRRSFWDYFENNETIRNNKHYSIAMGDLDNFKSINDTYGHGCGDLVLKSVAQIIINSTTSDEIVCRWGGEEMVIVFAGERSAGYNRLEGIRKQIEALCLTYEGLSVNVTMTFGFADCEEISRAISENELNDALDTSSVRVGIESLISMADKRLYVGKRSGKNKIVDK